MPRALTQGATPCLLQRYTLPTNAITFETDLLGKVTVVGPGAGRVETGFSILTDLLAIERSRA